jgi:hypothetical protein
MKNDLIHHQISRLTAAIPSYGELMFTPSDERCTTVAILIEVQSGA